MGVSQDITGALRAQEHGHQPSVVQQFYRAHPQDSRISGPCEVADTVTARYGTGGGNTPLILAFNPNQGENARGLGIQEEQAPTLGAEMKPPAVLVGCLTPGESQTRKVYGVGGGV